MEKVFSVGGGVELTRPEMPALLGQPGSKEGGAETVHTRTCNSVVLVQAGLIGWWD